LLGVRAETLARIERIIAVNPLELSDARLD